MIAECSPCDFFNSKTINKDMELWKPIEGSDGYEISTLGRCRVLKNHSFNYLRQVVLAPKAIPIKGIYKKRKSNTIHSKALTYKIKRNGRVCGNNIHNLMAEAFLPKESLILKNGQKRVSKRIEFIDGDSMNVSLDNLRWSFKKTNYIRKGTRRMVFPKNLSENIAQILSNTTEKNKGDNDILIKWLNGDNNAIGKLMIKYQAFYEFKLNWMIQKMHKSHAQKRKEAAITIQDIIMDASIMMMGKIKKGRFDGRNYKGWSGVVIARYFSEHLKRRREADLKDRVEVAYF